MLPSWVAGMVMIVLLDSNVTLAQRVCSTCIGRKQDACCCCLLQVLPQLQWWRQAMGPGALRGPVLHHDRSPAAHCLHGSEQPHADAIVTNVCELYIDVA
jgi:hypothetical protein